MCIIIPACWEPGTGDGSKSAAGHDGGVVEPRIVICC